jgi:hypothetical protein
MEERSKIRRLTADLLTGATDAGPRVYRSRTLPPKRPEFPLVLVYALNEDMTGGEGSGAPQFEHRLTLVVECGVLGSDEDADDRLDRLCSQILERLLSSPEWVGEFSRIGRIATTIAMPDEGDDDYIGAVIQIDGTYATEWPPRVDAVLGSVGFRVDAIDPADPNRAPDGGPDGRIEIGGEATLPPP